ncbi:uncharacterized protein LACBIDRAFT_308064 [Laccaria bicolor S238N-H82]|uniref:Predicted protein n=1 Tax=Laccaria bicolor (strain S238N-H82 / ATCC MYA-4686) TaxID=486041 RepID=B0DRJ7_LACBS|nr:uncharacterized protein LACBIDRAFT_308064 [Laccaria bicolor S238N-H82]EDR02884.1 predicted protein [Laccaria bicolor S238N-H82]|eukprot:XP_001886594.1 predicted protein [Laccaria bicolor S238N-H82]
MEFNVLGPKPVYRPQKTVVCGLFVVRSGLLTSGEKADRLRLRLTPLGIKKPDRTGLSNTTFTKSLGHDALLLPQHLLRMERTVVIARSEETGG